MNDPEFYSTLALPVHPITVTVQSFQASLAVRWISPNAPNIADIAGVRHQQIRLHLSPFFNCPFFSHKLNKEILLLMLLYS